MSITQVIQTITVIDESDQSTLVADKQDTYVSVRTRDGGADREVIVHIPHDEVATLARGLLGMVCATE